MTQTTNSKVAVVVVHGVAYHAPGASARAAAELLHGLRPHGGPSPYRADNEETVSIPLKQLKVTSPLKEGPEVIPPPGEEQERNVGWVGKVPILGYFARALQERTIFLTRAWRDEGAAKASHEPTNERVANDFMRLLLQDYRGVDRPVERPDAHDEAASYVTTCLKLTRDARLRSSSAGESGAPGQRSSGTEESPQSNTISNSANEQPEKMDVHIYECYWADLSRPDNTVLSFFQGLYQMLFHFASLSRLTISTGVLENRERRIWSALDWTQLWAVRMLTLPIPILNLILFISIFGALPHLVHTPEGARWAAMISAALLGLLANMIASPKMPATRWPLSWALMPVAFAVIFGGLVSLLAGKVSVWWILALEGWVFGAAIIYLSVSSYNEVRDGANEIAWTLYGVSFATFVGIVWHIGKPSETSVVQATLWMMQIVLAALRASWILLFLLAIATLVLGSVAWRSLPNGGKRARAKAAVRASRFALAMPTVGILIVTLALWSGLFVKVTKAAGPKANRCTDSSFATKLFSNELPAPWPQQPESRWRALLLNREEARTYLDPEACAYALVPNDYFQAIFVWSASQAFPVILLVLLAGNFLLVLWLLPSIFTERKPPRGSDNTSSKRMGAWLSRGLDATAITIALFWSAAFAWPLLFAILHHSQPDLFTYLNSPTAVILQWLGVATGSLAILASVAKSGSSVLGIILDVDNYLRTSPKEKTPRARIVERYVSLLRYLTNYKDEDGSGYDRIVILAHSLGALISGDLLLFLKTEGDPGLGRLGLGSPKVKEEAQIQLRLFTMGDPARQFLNRFFPYLYEWVREKPDNALQHLGGLVPTAPGTSLVGPPDPARLGVERWVNAYRSGDYIGRSLWLNEWYDRAVGGGTGAYPQAVYVAADIGASPIREEMCIGAGAHQHYWDQSAPDIAEKLDALIR